MEVDGLTTDHACGTCGIGNDARAAVAAIRAGAKEYLPLPPEADLIAAVLEAVAEDSHQMIFRDPAMGQLVKLAEQIAPSSASVAIAPPDVTTIARQPRFVASRNAARVSAVFPE